MASPEYLVGNKREREMSTMGGVTHEDLARRLREAYSSGAVPPLRDGLDPVDVAGAYAVQTINTRFWEGQGRRIVGRKAGLTAKAVQTQLGVDQPDFGVLFDDMRVADGGKLDSSRCLQPKAEAEIAFVLGADLPSPQTTPDEVAAAVATVHAAIEIVDSRIADWKITFADTVADNGSSAFFVLSDRRISSACLWKASKLFVLRERCPCPARRSPRLASLVQLLRARGVECHEALFKGCGSLLGGIRTFARGSGFVRDSRGFS